MQDHAKRNSAGCGVLFYGLYINIFLIIRYHNLLRKCVGHIIRKMHASSEAYAFGCAAGYLSVDRHIGKKVTAFLASLLKLMKSNEKSVD